MESLIDWTPVEADDQRHLDALKAQDVAFVDMDIPSLSREIARIWSLPRGNVQVVTPGAWSDQSVALLAGQLQDANRTLAALQVENAKLREDLRKLFHSAANPPQIQDLPAEFPALALMFSV